MNNFTTQTLAIDVSTLITYKMYVAVRGFTGFPSERIASKIEVEYKKMKFDPSNSWKITLPKFTHDALLY